MKSSKPKYTEDQIEALKSCCDQNEIYYNITKKNFIVKSVDEDNMTKAPAWFQHWADTEFKPLKEDVRQLKVDVAQLKSDVALIMRCPTIKREIAELDKEG